MLDVGNLKKFGRKVVVLAAMVIALTVNAVGVEAATFSATANSTWKKVTVSYSNCYGSTIFTLNGYEYHPETKHYYKCSMQSSYVSTGSLKATFSANTGYKFLQYYNKVYLTASVRVSGTVMGSLVVTN